MLFEIVEAGFPQPARLVVAPPSLRSPPPVAVFRLSSAESDEIGELLGPLSELVLERRWRVGTVAPVENTPAVVFADYGCNVILFHENGGVDV